MISIIIPTLNEAETISRLLNQLDHLNTWVPYEVIVVDGGSQDETVQLAEKTASVYQVKASNRGAQLRYGVTKSSGNILWFLHSDSQVMVQDDPLVAIETALMDARYSAGFFQLNFDSSDFFYKYLAWSSNLRAHYFGLIFGDQGLFTTRERYEKAGGFEAIPLMEDWRLSRRLHKLGKFYPVSLKITTSSRKFRNGKLRTHLNMHRIKLWYLLGMSPEELAKRYYR